jgi:PncC family amidohydrolase
MSGTSSANSADNWGVLVSIARRRKLSLAFAESCTGGMVGAAISDVPGASDVFLGGVVAYANQIKNEVLKVEQTLLEQHGAVSEAAALAMARGARALFQADIALSVTGIAGPGGGTKEKPIGTVWIALACEGSAYARCFHFSGSRSDVREQTVRQCVSILLEEMRRE